jgi:hypothetical protein
VTLTDYAPKSVVVFWAQPWRSNCSPYTAPMPLGSTGRGTRDRFRMVYSGRAAPYRSGRVDSARLDAGRQRELCEDVQM